MVCVEKEASYLRTDTDRDQRFHCWSLLSIQIDCITWAPPPDMSLRPPGMDTPSSRQRARSFDTSSLLQGQSMLQAEHTDSTGH